MFLSYNVLLTPVALRVKLGHSISRSGSGTMAPKRPVVLITGGSRGIGAAVAHLAARRGYDIGVNYRSDGPAAGAVVEACRAAGAAAFACQGDMAVSADVVRVFDETRNAL